MHEWRLFLLLLASLVDAAPNPVDTSRFVWQWFAQTEKESLTLPQKHDTETRSYLIRFQECDEEARKRSDCDPDEIAVDASSLLECCPNVNILYVFPSIRSFAASNVSHEDLALIEQAANIALVEPVNPFREVVALVSHYYCIASHCTRSISF